MATKSLDIVSEVSIVRYGSTVRLSSIGNFVQGCSKFQFPFARRIHLRPLTPVEKMDLSSKEKGQATMHINVIRSSPFWKVSTVLACGLLLALLFPDNHSTVRS